MGKNDFEGRRYGVNGNHGSILFAYICPCHTLSLQVKRQRERFRKEALRREKEASIAKGNAEQLTRDNQELRRENMHLYKKIR